MFDTTTTTKETSARALASVGINRLKWIQDEIEHIVRSACAAGVKDLSMREIQQRYEATYGSRIEMSTISSRVWGLVAAKRLQRDSTERKCSVTGQFILPVSTISKG